MLYKTNWYKGRSTKMAAAMHNKFRMLFQLRISSVRPSIRDFHRLTSPSSFSVSLVQFRDQKQSNTSGINFNRNGFLFTSGRTSSFSSVLSVRFKSSSGGTFDAPYISPPPKIPQDSEIIESTVSETVNALNALGEPTLQSLGLGSWTPPGMVQQLLEYIHITLDIPWWGAICVLTVCVRVAMFPLFIKSQINAAKLHNITPEMTRLQARFSEARRANDMVDMAIAHRDLSDFMIRSKFSPFMMMYPMLQSPVLISVYLGLKGMATVPVESMKDGGILWFTDLTIADPTYLLPVLCSGLLLATIEVGADGVSSQSMKPSVRWFLRGMPIILIPVMINFPSGMLCYWVTSNVISLSLVSILKIPGVKPFFKIPQRVLHPKEVKSTTAKKPVLASIKENWENVKLQERIKRKDAMDSNLFKQAASGPIPKTYSVDPTRGKSTKAKSSSNTSPGKWKVPFSKN